MGPCFSRKVKHGDIAQENHGAVPLERRKNLKLAVYILSMRCLINGIIYDVYTRIPDDERLFAYVSHAQI